jgi:hypothetical protein
MKTALKYFLDEIKNHKQIGLFDNTGSNELLKLIDISLKLEQKQIERAVDDTYHSCILIESDSDNYERITPIEGDKYYNKTYK